jgi:uncharacterized membrane protein YphA (DoxX/SURF4 family)
MAPIFLSILRIVSGLIFLEHGTQKFLSFPAGAAARPSPISAPMPVSSNSPAAS